MLLQSTDDSQFSYKPPKFTVPCSHN